MDFQKWVGFSCSLKVYDGRGIPRGHNCQFSFGIIDDKPCFQVVQSTGGKKTMRFSPANVGSMAGQRVEEGNLTINFEGLNWNMVVINDAKDKAALRKLYELLGEMRTGEMPSGCDRTPTNVSSQRGVASSDGSGKRRPPLSLSSKDPSSWRGLAMVAAAQGSKTTKQSGGFYKSSAPHVDPFLPSQQLKVSPASTKAGGYFFKSSSVRRNLSVDMGHHQQLTSSSAAGDENDMNDFQQPKNSRQPSGPPSRSPLTDLLSQPPSTTLHYPSPVRISEDAEGFTNLGNTCYMNAVLQSLLGLEPFADDLLYHRLVTSVHPNSLYRMLFLLLKWKRSKDTFESQRILLKKIKAAISARASKFLGYRQQDAHELLSQCLDQLQDDLGHLGKSNGDSTDGGPLSPVVRNFECDIKHTITCKSCGKVTTNTEKIYDFALQLPKSVLLRPNEQANLQKLFDLYFSSEEVEYTCPVCSGKAASLSHQLARLPRVLVLFLKRYGYNSQLSKNSKRVDNIRIPRFINTKHLCVDNAEPPCEFRGPWPKDPAALSELATNSEDKENVPRMNHQAPSNQTNLSIANTSSDIIPASSKINDITPSSSNDVIPSSISAESAPHRTDQLHECPVSPIYPSPPLLSRDTEWNAESNSTYHRNECDFAQRDHSEVQGNHSDRQLTQVDHSERQLTQGDHNEHKPMQGSSAPPSSPVYEQEAPVIVHSGEKHNDGGCVLGKRTSSERDSHSSDDGYCTCGSSCDSTPSGSTIAAASCICHNKAKRIEYRSTEPQLSSEGGGITNVSDDRQKEKGYANTEKCIQIGENSNANVNKILDECDRIFESPEAVAALKWEERLSTLAATPPAVSNYQAELRPSTPQLPQLVEAGPVLLADSRVSNSTNEQKLPDIELEIGLEEIAKREDEELKKAMEESLKQQPNDLQLLQQLGMSEEDQLKLALELSIQESLPEEALLPPSPSPSSLTPVAGTPTKENIDQNNRTVSPEPSNLEVYRLVSVVSHIGRGSSGGHYISDVYSIGDHAWRTYNDSQVVDTREEDVRQRRQCTGYIFFYMHRSTFNSVAKHHKH